MGTSASAQPEYSATETLYEGRYTTLVRALRGSDGRRVVLKVIDPRRGRERDLERLRREYDTARSLDVSAIIRPVAFETFQGMPALVLEDFGGESLDRLLGRPMPMATFLDLAVGTAGAVCELHERGVIHKDLKPENVLVHPVTGEVKLIDLGIATRLPREQQAARPPLLIEGTLPYMSPEQTGRMNRALDSRSDLYSLGVTFYKMLTGRLPFEARDPLEWLHCHVARAPVPPSRLVPAIPEAIERIVMRLLAKMAEDRYQTARGLEHDLVRCREQWRETGRIHPFALGERDVPERLQIPQRLYGRDEQVRELLRAFDRVVDTGAPAVVMVSGYSGIGKSSLVHEIHKPIVERRGLFVEGKFDQYKRDIPYSTVAQAFRGLVLDVLAEEEERVGDWRERLRGAVGMNGRLIAGIIPEIEILLGKQPPVPELPLAEARRRFHLVFRAFLGVFAREEHPLTLFLDDLQWADAASLELLEELVTHPEARHLLFVGAYRDNEVTATHPLLAMLAALRGAGVAVHDLSLAPLSRGDLRQFVADAMRSSPDGVRELAELVGEKTGGNPFFAIQFLTSLQQDGLVRFDREARAWRCDVTAARAKGYTDNVVDMMVAKLQRLAPAAQEAVRLAACMGNVVAADTLAMLRGEAAAEAHQELWPLMREGLLDRSGDRYRFSHDRVQQAAYALIPEDRRGATHLRIGQILLAHTNGVDLGDAVFDIVNQLNLGAPLMSSRGERTRAAELNLLAGRRAKASAAYAGAAQYVTRGIALLDEESWDLAYELTFGLHFELAELEYLLGNRRRSQELVAALLAHARDEYDRATVYEFLVDLHTTEQDNEKAVDTALRCLALFGIHLSPHPTREDVQREYDELWRNLGDREIEELIHLPAMTDRRTQAALSALAAPTVAAMFTDLNLLLQLSCQMVNLCLLHGNADASVVGYVWLGIALGPVFGKYAEGYRFGKLAYDYVQEHRLVALKPRIDICFGDLINFWTKPLQTDLEYLRDGFKAAVELGDLTYACYCANHIVTVMITQGSPLEAVYRESEVRLDFVRKARYAPVVDEIVSMQRFIQNMRGLTTHFSTFDDATFDQRAFEEHLRREVRPLTVCWYYILKLAARFMSGDHAEALEAAERARALLWSTPGHMQVPEYHYYRALALAAACAGAPSDEQRRYLDALREHEAQFREWAENCPENFGSKSALVSAELARLSGADFEAMRLYERAVRSASENGLVQNEAIAYELASAFYRERGFEAFSEAYLRRALACYRRWGADGKVRQLERLHRGLLETWPPAPSATIAVRSEQLDLLSVLKASQTLSREIEIEKLLGTLLQVVLEQGGARRGCLVLERDGAFFVEAEASMEETGMKTRILPSLPMESSLLVPLSIIRYARSTRQPVILEDVSAGEGAFTSDAYFSRRRPRSVLCLPILRQAELVGLLYLENQYVAGAFTRDRLTALSLLASQAAISVENARFLREERQGRRRSAFLAEAGVLLSESLNYEETLARLSRLCVQSLADWCVLDVLEGGEIRRLAGACAEPAKEPLLEALRERHPARQDSPHPSARSLRAGEPLLLSAIPDDELRSICEDEDHLELARALGTRSVVAVPLVARGQTLGILSLASGTPGRYQRADLELASEVAHRAAMAIDNARLYRELKRTDQRKSEFIAVLSHELRNPLAPIRTGLQLLRRASSDSPMAVRAREIMERQTEHLTRLVNDLLDITRISHGRIELQRTRVDLREVVRSTCDDLRSLFERGSLELRLESTSDPLWVEADATRLAQVLGNLLQNAVKFTPAGGRVTVHVAPAGGRAVVSVRDTGVGIAADVMKRIFEPFAQAEQGLARTEGGLGLGLALAKGLVELHGGSVEARSEGPGRGSEFVVTLPLAGPRQG